jgi:hypothetical protein
MKILRRILITLVILFAAQYFIVPAVVLYFARRAPAVTSVVPTDLKDLSVSQAPGTKLSYVGYDFEVPWSDLDKSQTQVSEGDPAFQIAGICFRSGLKLFISSAPPHKEYPEYALLKQIYAITPDRIHYWALFKGGQYRDARLLLAKSALLRHIGLGFEANPAETGIFNVQSQGYRGFQYGDPQEWQPALELRLFSDDSTVKIEILQKDYDDPMGVTQPEINRIIQSLHKAAPSDSSKSLAATSK